MNSEYRISVKALLRNGDDILVLREAEGDNSGKYHFPGGHLEPGESLEQALRREILQETGIDQVKIGLPYFVCEWPARIDGKPCLVIGIFYPVTTAQRQVKTGAEHDRSLWMLPADYRKYPMVELSEQIISRYMELERIGGLEI